MHGPYTAKVTINQAAPLAEQVARAAAARYGHALIEETPDGPVVRVPSLRLAWTAADFDLALLLLSDDVLSDDSLLEL